jgi:hypothetical protein
VSRALVRALAVTDAAIDEVLYRPAVVKAFVRLPRWWNCDLARLSMRLDDRWGTGYWDEAGIAPGGPCDACGRRAAIHMLGGPPDDPQEDDAPRWYLEDHPVHLCGWCRIEGRIDDAAALEAALTAARPKSVSWRWRARR